MKIKFIHTVTKQYFYFLFSFKILLLKYIEINVCYIMLYLPVCSTLFFAHVFLSLIFPSYHLYSLQSFTLYCLYSLVLDHILEEVVDINFKLICSPLLVGMNKEPPFSAFQKVQSVHKYLHNHFSVKNFHFVFENYGQHFGVINLHAFFQTVMQNVSKTFDLSATLLTLFKCLK